MKALAGSDEKSLAKVLLLDEEENPIPLFLHVVRKGICYYADNGQETLYGIHKKELNHLSLIQKDLDRLFKNPISEESKEKERIWIEAQEWNIEESICAFFLLYHDEPETFQFVSTDFIEGYKANIQELLEDREFNEKPDYDLLIPIDEVERLTYFNDEIRNQLHRYTDLEGELLVGKRFINMNQNKDILGDIEEFPFSKNGYARCLSPDGKYFFMNIDDGTSYMIEGPLNQGILSQLINMSIDIREYIEQNCLSDREKLEDHDKEIEKFEDDEMEM